MSPEAKPLRGRLGILCLALLLTPFQPGSIAAQSASDAQKPAPAAAPQSTDQPAPATTMSVEVNVVNVLATVRDKHGKVMSDLGKDDFTLEEDGLSLIHI